MEIPKKTIYIFICLLLSVKFWNLSFMGFFINSDFNLLLTWFWAFSALFIFNKEISNRFGTFKFNNFFLFIFIGVFISMFSAYFFWEQDFFITLLAQRGVYSFILLPAILRVQPTKYNIIQSLKWITIGTISVWFLSIIYPQLINNYKVLDNENNFDNTNIGFKVAGIHFVVLYLYLKIEDYIKFFNLNTFILAFILLLFLILYQNRAMLLGSIPVFLYSFVKFKSKNKFLLILLLSVILVFGIIYTSHIWTAIIEETQSQIENPEYNRWKSLYYYLFEYSPNWFCTMFGNGFPSAHTSFGKLMWSNFEQGIYKSDLGLIGMWIDFGLIPLISIYTVIFVVIKNNYFPLFLKFMCFHILLAPTIFHFWRNPGVMFFVLIFYLYIYYKKKRFSKYVEYNYSKL